MNTLQADPSILNEFFNNIAERLVREKTTHDGVILSQINSLTSNPLCFKVRKATYDEVLKCHKSLPNYCSAGYGNILVSFIKLAAKDIASLLIFLIISFYLIEETEEALSATWSKFPDQWKAARISPIRKVTNPAELKDNVRYQFFRFYQKRAKN